MWFMKNQGKGCSFDEMMGLTPFEFTLFYNMAVKDARDEEEAHRKAKAEHERLMANR